MFRQSTKLKSLLGFRVVMSLQHNNSDITEKKKRLVKQSYEIQASRGFGYYVLKFKRMLFYESSSSENRPTWLTNKQEQTTLGLPVCSLHKFVPHIEL